VSAAAHPPADPNQSAGGGSPGERPRALELRNLVKHYRGGGETVRAVDGVSLLVRPGELVALYGPSGSGKSTLLMLAAALMRPDQGEVIFDGERVDRLDAGGSAAYRSRTVGLISQEFHLMPGASALDNALIKLPTLGLSLKQARERTVPWLERVGLSEKLHRTPDRLSMGERQRVTIARALVAEPKLLLADEPTGSLDSVRTREILSLLADLCRERSMPGLLVTHDADAVAFVDRVLTLRDGRLIGELEGGGSPAEPATARISQ